MITIFLNHGYHQHRFVAKVLIQILETALHNGQLDKKLVWISIQHNSVSGTKTTPHRSSNINPWTSPSLLLSLCQSLIHPLAQPAIPAILFAYMAWRLSASRYLKSPTEPLEIIVKKTLVAEGPAGSFHLHPCQHSIYMRCDRWKSTVANCFTSVAHTSLHNSHLHLDACLTCQKWPATQQGHSGYTSV